MKEKGLNEEIFCKLKSSLIEKTRKIVAYNLREYYNNNLKISGVINYYLTEDDDDSLIDIWSDDEIQSFRIIKSYEELEQKFTEEQKISEQFKLKTNIDPFDIYPMSRATNILLAKKLRKALIDDGYFVTVKKKQKLTSERTAKWILTLAHVGSFSNYDTKFWDESSDKFYMPWPVVLDSYVRDFELYFKYIIRPVLYSNNNKCKSYHEDMEVFFKEDIKFLSLIRKEFMKPWLRSKLIHNQYYIIPEKEVIRFFDSEEDEEIERELKFSDLTYMMGELNVFLWMSLAVIYKAQKVKLSPIIETLIGPQIEFFHTKEQYMTELKTLAKFKSRVLTRTLNELNINLPKPFYESIHHLKILSEKIDGHYSTISWIFFKVMFLISYSVMIEKYVQPIASTLNPNLDKLATDEEMLDIIANYRKGEFNYLFKWVDFELRNALAHYSYDSEKDSKIYYINREGKKIEIILGFMNGNRIIINELDPVFDPELIADELDKKIVEAIIHLFYKHDMFQVPEFYINLSNELLKNKKYHLLGIISMIAAGFFFINRNDLMNAKVVFADANKESKKLVDSDLEVVWSWIVNRYEVLLLNSKKKELNLLFKEYRIYPKDQFSLLFKIIFLYENGERKKANELFTRKDKIKIF